MSENILADVDEEGEIEDFQDLDKEKETPSESPAEKEPKDEEEKDKPEESDDSKKEGDNTPEKELPFHEHPRWKAREEELNTLREENEITARELAELKEEVSKKAEPEGEVPDWFIELYGDNKTAWRKYEVHEQEKEQAIEAKLLERQEQTRKKNEDETLKWNKWVDDEISKLQEEGKKFDRNKLIKVMLDYSPTTNNSFDFQKGYKIYEKLETEDPAKSNARKELADATTKTDKTEKKSKDYMTSNELRGKSWHEL